MLKRRRLPHLDVLDKPVFITFRLHDSLPANRAFSTSTLTSGQAFVAMDRLLDHAQSGPMFLRQPEIAEVVRASLYCGEELGHYELHAWVIMPNHVHVLLTPRVDVSKLLAGLKGATAKRANALLNRAGQPFWQDESFDRVVRNGDQFGRIRRYIDNNPVAAGLAPTPEEYPWSSARRPERPPQA
jgi:putative DNA methylase